MSNVNNWDRLGLLWREGRAGTYMIKRKMTQTLGHVRLGYNLPLTSVQST
jgi:hypothetical protein